MILLIDNYDSFVNNIARYLRRLGFETLVVRNDQIQLETIVQLKPAAILLSPGPCDPDKAGICIELVSQLKGSIPMLGICLGHQVIGAAFGSRIVGAIEPYHGRQSTLSHNGHALFRNVPGRFDACRYHSLVIERETLPENLEVIAEAVDSTVMAIADDQLGLYGVQFHPESILTPCGFQVIQNFLQLAIPVEEKQDDVPSIQQLFATESRRRSNPTGAAT